jgi:hypothetical protein
LASALTANSSSIKGVQEVQSVLISNAISVDTQFTFNFDGVETGKVIYLKKTNSLTNQ